MAEQPNNAVPVKAKSNNLIFLVIGIVLLAGGMGAGWFLFAHNKTTQAAAEKPEKKEPEFTLHLDGFTVNLNDPDENHFLRCTIDLSLAHEPKAAAGGKEGEASSGLPIPRIRDTILSVLTAAKANELLTVEGKENLKHNVLAALQQRVPEIEAQDVYFTEFLVQR
jgi:flagellar protein FliL